MERIEGPVVWLAAASGAGALLVLAALIMAALTSESKRGAAWILIVFGLALPVLGQWFVVSEAVWSFRDAISGMDPSTKASEVARAMSTMVDGALVAGIALVAISSLVGIAAGLIARHRGAVAVLVGGASGGSVMLAGGGIALYAFQLITAFENVAVVDASNKAVVLAEGVSEAQPFLVWPLVAAGVLVTVLLAGAMSSRTSWNGGWATASASLLGAVVIAFLALPYGREVSAEPLPFSATGDVVYAEPGIETPALRGPDPIEHGPTIVLSSERASLEGMDVGLDGVAAKLREMTEMQKMLNPDATASSVLLLCDRRTPASRAAAMLREVRAAGHGEVMVVFRRTKTFQRPMLGPLTASGSSGARLALVASDGSTALAFGEEDFDSVARRLVALRGQGTSVHLSD